MQKQQAWQGHPREAHPRQCGPGHQDHHGWMGSLSEVEHPWLWVGLGEPFKGVCEVRYINRNHTIVNIKYALQGRR